MRRIFSVGICCLLVSVVLAAATLVRIKVKTGLWQTTVSTDMKGLSGMSIPPDLLARMTPEQRARAEAAMGSLPGTLAKPHTYKSCVTEQDLEKDPFADKKQQCTYTILTSTSSKLAAHVVCSQGNTKMDYTVQFEALDSENTKGTAHGTITNGGHTMTTDSTLTGKWLGASCGDVK